jgi:PAS domain S-box-containing protein
VPAALATIVSAALAEGTVARHKVAFGSHIYGLTVAPSVAEGHVNIYTRDITSYKRAEEAIGQAERRFRAIFDNTSDGIFLLEWKTLKLTMANKSCLQMLGYTEEEFTKLTVADLHPEEDLPFIHAQIDKFLTGGKPVRHDIRFKRKDGSILFADLSPDLIKLDGVRYVLVALKDITERKRMEEELRRYSEHLAELVERRTGELQFTQFAIDHTADSAFWMTDAGRFFYVNEAACRALGYSREELLQMTVFDIDPAFTQSLWLETWRKLKAEKSIVLETVHRARDGRTYPVEIRANYLEFGGRAYDCAFARDITERKRVEEALREKDYLLSESQRIGHIGSWSVDLATGTAAWSSETYRLYGVSPDTFTPSADALLGLLHPDDRAALQEWIRATLAGEHPRALEMRAILPDGSVRVLSGRGELVWDDDHRPVRLVGTVQNVTEQKQVQEALRESEAGLAAAQHLAHFGSWEWNIVADTAHWSEETFRIFGMAPGTLQQHRQDFLSRIVPEDRQRVDQALRDALSGARDYDLDYRIRLPDGCEKVIHAQARVLRSSDGRPVTMHGTVQDITERKRAEDALRESEERFRTAFEEGAVAMALTALDSTLLKVNSSFCRMLGFSASELVGRSFAEITHPDDRAVNFVGTRRLACGEIACFHMEERYIRKDGTVVWGDMSTASVRDAQGRPLYCVTHIQDITDRKQAEEALRQSERRYRKLFEANLAGVYLTKTDGTILDFNDAMMRMLGYRAREEVFQHRSSDFYVDPECRRELMRLLQEDGAVPAMEAVLRRKDGSVLHALGSAVLLVNEQTGETYIQGAAIDITERKRAEEALRELNATLEAKVTERTEDLRHTVGRLRQLTLELSQAEDRERQRIADILHEEVQQTLAAAKFHLNLLTSEPRSAEESRELVEQIKNMLRDAIERSRNLSHELSPALYQVELLEILNWLARHMREKHGLTVHVEAHGPVDSPPEPLKAFLYKVAQELLFNVVKHAGVTEAQIRVRRWGRGLYLSIVDRGRGFDPQSLERSAGSGLLSIRERVQLLGGRMKIKSTPGAGSRFLIAVPYEAVSSVAAPSEHEDGQAPSEAPAQPACKVGP